MAEESAVKVCVRVRPLIERESSAGSENADPVQYFWKADAKSIYQIDDGNPSKTFSFDRVFTAEETTSQLYQAIAKPLVVSSVQGYNGTIFAYGQTASGKTFTMMGSDRFPGVIPQAVEDVFQTIKSCPKKEFLLRVSYMEIYNETVSDLLVDSWKRKPLEVRETINKNIYVADLTEELVTSPAQALSWIRKGEKNRHYGKTKMNERSSRSHTIFRMILESRERSDPASGENADGAIIVSHLNLVDLAGSERASQTGAEGTRFKEGCNINRSLFTLGQVIKKLTDEGQKGFTNYRDSKLTRILQNSLGGNAKTVIICTITPVTLDETLSTLQFASTAKKMKNDPHVTEVSDEGALLKRYRNEIEDLKRRLNEVSSVTQTTAKEKNSLSQMLQEKDQLQREQEDRIRNLTTLLVTSSNLVPARKIPKRRETWGGKMHGHARRSKCYGGLSDHSFADSFTGKRKADRSCLSELGEDDKDFLWEIPDEPSDEMDMSNAFVGVRSFGDSPKDFVSPNHMHELSGRVSNLELQLDVEAQQKQDALDKIQTIQQRAEELELKLQVEAEQKQEAIDKTQSTEQRVQELELELQMEAEQKLKALEQVKILGVRLADIGSQNEDQTNTQMKKDFAETIHLCETLSTEKDMVLAERDYLKQELGKFLEQIEILEKEKAALSQELEERREVDEFKALEEEFRKEHESELQSDIANLKKTVEASELQCLDLQNKLQTLTGDLRKKTEFAEELQSMSGKDLVQEVEKLRRSLDDAEGLSRDTKKEWAVLRSEHMAVEEMNGVLSANHEKMEAEVRSLRYELETQKTRFRKMQSDLQKELNVAFDENTKLTTLLDGKVPQNLIDNMELERRVAQLSRELTVSQEAEGVLKAQLEELASFQTLPEKVDHLMKQQSELSEELQSVQSEKEALLSEQSAAARSSAEELEKLLSAVTSLTAERDQLQRDLQENVDMAAETQILLQSIQEEMQQQRTQHSDLVKLSEQKESDLGEQMLSLSQELESVQAEKEALLSEQNAAAQSSAEELEKLLSAVTSLTEERDQLLRDLQENVDMMIENQEELRTALEKIRQQKERIKQLQAAETSRKEAPPNQPSAQTQELQTLMMENQEKVRVLQEEISSLKSQEAESRAGDGSDAEISLQLQELHNQIQRLSEELESMRAERDALLSERTPDTQEEMEKLQCRVTSLSEEREQLQEILEGLRQEKQQLRAQLEERMEMVAQAQSEFIQPEILTSELHDEEVINLQQEIKQLQDTLQTVNEQKSQLEVDLQRNMEKATETESLLHSLQQQVEEHHQRNTDLVTLSQEQQAQLQQHVEETQRSLHSLQEELQQQKQHHSEHLQLCGQKECDLEQQIKGLTELVESVRAERDALFVKEASGPSSTEEMEKLQCRVTSLSEEREQLQETLEGLRQEKQQLRAQLEERMEMMQCDFQQQLSSEPQSLKEEQEAQQLLQIQQLEEYLEKAKEEGSQLKSDLQENVELMKTLTGQLESIEAERDALLSEKESSGQSSTEEMEKLQCRVTSLSEEREQLQETLERLRQENQQLRAQLEDRMETMQTEMANLNTSLQIASEQKRKLEDDLQQNMNTASTAQELLKSVQEKLCEQQQKNSELEELCQEKERSSDQQMKTLTEQLESIEAERDALLSEKECSGQSATEEMEKLQCRVTSLSEEKEQLQETLEGLRQETQQLRAQLEDRMETMQTEMKTLTEQLESIEAERDALLSEKESSGPSSMEEMEKLQCRVTSLSEEREQLQEILEGLRKEKQQLRAQLEDRMEMVSATKEKLSDREQLDSQQQAERGAQETKLQQRVEEELQTHMEKKGEAEVGAHTSQQLLSDANTSICVLREQQSSLDQSISGLKAEMASQLQESAEQLQESFGKFQQFIDACSKYNSTGPAKVACSLTSLPKPLMKVYHCVCHLQQQTAECLSDTLEHLKSKAQSYMKVFEELVSTDLAVFKERRALDVLLCRGKAQSEVNVEDFHSMWDNRLKELVDKRQLYLQKMSSILEKLWACIASFPSELSVDNSDRERFKEQLQSVFSQAMIFGHLESVLSTELVYLSELEHRRKTTLKGHIKEQDSLLGGLKLLKAQAEAQLTEERSKISNLLVLQLKQTEDKVKALREQIEQLQEAQVKASNRVSNHKQATQLLQTELNDSRAHVEEREHTIQTLRSKLRESQRNASPSALELEKLRSELFKKEVLLTSASDKHKQEIQTMNTVLKEKEESLRKLKETLRKSQQQGEQSFLQGEDLHARLTNPRGLVIKTSILLEKTKLEEELKQLQLKLTELESLVSNQQAEISHWKSRAFKLKGRIKAEVAQPSSPSTPTKRGYPMTSDSSNFFSSPKKFLVTPKKVLDSPRKVLDSPRKLLDSPNVSALDSPKSRFFDVGGNSELLSRSRPKQFFDNSRLGTIPEISFVPDPPDTEKDAASGADQREDWWPKSPKQEEMCKSQ
ncbi:centromere-associated protein E isoform X2 [Eleginops maclovinus]|uniref:centromere-associated protein E isoform X2 n=1 Tax=Eleginops maclovinus TaxID=56733 RepID=UPI0030806BC5